MAEGRKERGIFASEKSHNNGARGSNGHNADTRPYAAMCRYRLCIDSNKVLRQFGKKFALIAPEKSS